MSDITLWPWPRILLTQYKAYLVSRADGALTLSELFYTSAGYWGVFPVLNLGPATDVAQVTIADFGPFYIVATLGAGAHQRQMFVRNLQVSLGYAFASFKVAPQPCGVVMNNNGQFLGANCAPSGDLNERSVLWSAIGNYELSPERSIEAGYGQTMPDQVVRARTVVHALRALGENILAYCDHGTVALRPAFNEVVTYGQTMFASLGVASGNHIAGDRNVHGLIDLSGEFWIITGQGPTRRGYREFIQPLLTGAAPVLVSYCSHEQTFYISNGEACLTINRFGAHHMHQCVSSAVVMPEGITGTFKSQGDLEARITSDALDFGSRGIKSVESILADTNMPATAMLRIATDWRVNYSHAFATSAWRPAGPMGRAGMHVAALEHRLKLRYSNYVDVELTGLLTNVKYSDQRFKRGTVPAQYDTGRGSIE